MRTVSEWSFAGIGNVPMQVIRRVAIACVCAWCLLSGAAVARDAPDAAVPSAFVASTKLQAPPRPGDGGGGDGFARRLDVSGDTAIIGAAGDSLFVDGRPTRGSAYIYVRGASTWTLQAKLVATDSRPQDSFGGSVAIDGDTAVVGSIFGNNDRGAAYVFVRQGTTWTQQQRLVPEAPQTFEEFGTRVAISGETILVTAPVRTVGANANQGAAFVFVRSGGTWSQQAQLIRPNGTANGRLGQAVALDGNTVILGDSGRESALVFTRVGSTWSLVQTLLASDANPSNFFGGNVAVQGNTALVGAGGRENGRGAVYAFVRNGGPFIEQDILTPSVDTVRDNFAAAVALDGERAVGAPPRPDFFGQGALFVYERTGNDWLETARLLAASGQPEDRLGTDLVLQGGVVLGGAPGARIAANNDQGAAYEFLHAGGTVWNQGQRLDSGNGGTFAGMGRAVAVFDRWAVVGAPREDVGNDDMRGVAHVYAREGSTWTYDARLIAPDGAAEDFFGSAVAVSASHIAVGAPGRNRAASADQGAAYVFVRDGNAWVPQATLLAPTSDQFDAGVGYGSSLALQGTRLLVGAPGARSAGQANAGAGFVLERNGANWSPVARLSAPDAAADDRAGTAVALDGGTAVLGAPGDDVDGRSNQGSASVYVTTGGAWAFQARLAAPDGEASDDAGGAVGLVLDQALLGVPDAAISGRMQQGAVRVFTRSGGVWSAGQKPVASDGSQFDSFGSAIAMTATTALIGNDFVTEPVYVFTNVGGTFTQT